MPAQRLIIWTVSLVLGLTCLPAVASEQDHHAQDSDAPGAAHMTAENDYSAAVRSLDPHLDRIAELIESEQLADLHKAAEPIKAIAKTLAKLAFSDDSGVPKGDVRQINLTAKALAATWDKIDEAGDSGDLDASKKVYQEMVDLIHTLKQYATAGNESHQEHAETDGHDDQHDDDQHDNDEHEDDNDKPADDKHHH